MVENLLSFAIFALWVVLCLRGYRHLGVFGVAAAGLLFFVGATAVWHRWHMRGNIQPLVIAEFFLFMAAVGSFQFGVAAQGLFTGEIRTTELNGVAATSLYPLLLAPTGEPIYRNESPARFMFEVMGRAVMGLLLAFFLPLLMMVWRFNHG